MSAASIPVVNGRVPCPCGSGRRYKACHGRRGAEIPPNPRPFAGHPSEPDIVALRELVPSATAPLPVSGEREVVLGTALPLALPALVRASGSVLVALQTPARSNDPGRDVAQAIEAGLAAAPSTNIDGLAAPGPGPSFTDLAGATPLDVTVHDGFDWWIENVDGLGEDEAAALEQANSQVVPTVRLMSVEAAYWCRIGERAHLRWALPQEEDPLLDAFARLHHARSFDLGSDTRFVGAFRACGLLIPVWDLPAGREADDVEVSASALGSRLGEALAEKMPLSADERASRAGIVSRQLTIR